MRESMLDIVHTFERLTGSELDCSVKTGGQSDIRSLSFLHRTHSGRHQTHTLGASEPRDIPSCLGVDGMPTNERARET